MRGGGRGYGGAGVGSNVLWSKKAVFEVPLPITVSVRIPLSVPEVPSDTL